MVALAIGLGTAALTHEVGLSVALGAFLAGLVISNSDYAHEALARLLPVRDILVAVFFVTIGCLIDPASVIAHVPLLLVIVALVVAGKLVIRTAVVRVFGYPLSTALLVGVGLTQIGEFSFILVQVARAAGHVGEDVYNATLAASLLTILVNATLVKLVPWWLARRQAAPAAPGPASHDGRVVLCGFGRVGSAVGEALDTFALPYTVVDRNPDVVAGAPGPRHRVHLRRRRPAHGAARGGRGARRAGRRGPIRGRRGRARRPLDERDGHPDRTRPRRGRRRRPAAWRRNGGGPARDGGGGHRGAARPRARCGCPTTRRARTSTASAGPWRRRTTRRRRRAGSPRCASSR